MARTTGGKLNETVLFLAARILKAAGYDVQAVVSVLREVYGVDVSPDLVRLWFDTIPPEIQRKPTLVKLISTIKKENLWALRYIAGAALGDGDRSGRLRVKDFLFIDSFARALNIFSNARVRRMRDGRYTTGKNSLVSFIVSTGLWRVLAYLDKHDEIKFFLGGLMDSEGTISPKLDRAVKRLRVQIWFCSTNIELYEYVRDAFKDLGLNPREAPMLGDIRKINGRTLVRTKKLYRVYTILKPSQLEPFASKVGFRCSYKQQLLAFFTSIANKDPREIYDEFTENWVKVDGKWKPRSKLSSSGHLILRKIKQRPRRKTRNILSSARSEKTKHQALKYP